MLCYAGGMEITPFIAGCFGDEHCDIRKIMFLCGILLNVLKIPFQISHFRIACVSDEYGEGAFTFFLSFIRLRTYISIERNKCVHARVRCINKDCFDCCCRHIRVCLRVLVCISIACCLLHRLTLSYLICLLFFIL